MTTDTDVRHMRHALALGARGQGRVAPRPSVGCVIVQDGRVVGRGVTEASPVRHGEVVALAQAGEQARGATAYVTLEPCSHQGATPPCADALIQAGVSRVVVALEDPDPRVAGQGLARLRAAGIDVDVGVLEDEARKAHAGFLTRISHGRPSLTLKLAMTLDGRIATASGESQWITGPLARREVHRLRMSHDAVLVGAGTAREDDPTLTVRGLGATSQPVRVVASRHMNLPFPSKLSNSIQDGPVWILHGPSVTDSAEAERWRACGAKCHAVQTAGGQLEPADMLRVLGEAGATRVFCEGGGTLAASFLGNGLVDDLIVFSAGVFIGAEGLPGIGALGLSALAEAPKFHLVDVRRVGGDILQHWRA